ncbi:unnamed protein product, partial [Scytosiphon promiscuus]
MRLHGDSCSSFADPCVSGSVGNRDRTQEIMSTSIVLVTALNPNIGYDKAFKLRDARASSSLATARWATG